MDTDTFKMVCDIILKRIPKLRKDGVKKLTLSDTVFEIELSDPQETMSVSIPGIDMDNKESIEPETKGSSSTEDDLDTYHLD